MRGAAIALGLALVAAGAAARAAPGPYTDPATFAANVKGGTADFDFEALAPGTSLSGTTRTPPGAAAGIVLPPALADVLDPMGPALDLRVVEGADNPAGSGARSMGVADPGNFDAVTGGSSLAFATTAPVEAFGLTVITPEEPGQALLDGDLRLVVPGVATAQLALADGSLLGSFGGREYRAYFLGVIGASGFSSATLEAGPGVPTSAFFFNVDDLVLPVPEPASGPVLGAGAALLLGLARRRREVRRTRR